MSVYCIELMRLGGEEEIKKIFVFTLLKAHKSFEHNNNIVAKDKQQFFFSENKINFNYNFFIFLFIFWILLHRNTEEIFSSNQEKFSL